MSPSPESCRKSTLAEAAGPTSTPHHRLSRPPRRQPLRRRAILPVAFGLVMFAGILGFIVFRDFFAIDQAMRQAVAGEYHRLLAAELVLRPGDRLDGDILRRRLAMLGFSEKQAATTEERTWWGKGESLYVNPAESGKGVTTVCLSLADGRLQQLTRVTDGVLLADLKLGRPLLTAFRESIWELRYPLSYAGLPQDLVNGLLAAEDTSFFRHPGIDPRGIARAAWVNFRQGRVVQGGSTITQQLVKSLQGRSERELELKMREALVAMLIEFFFSKEEILAAYCNSVYMGRIGPFALHGMVAAARHLLGKELAELSPLDCGVLAGLIRSPNRLSPLRHPDEALQRAEQVLNRMEHLELLTENVTLRNPDRDDAAIEGLLARAWYYEATEQEIDRLLAKRQSWLGGPVTVLLGMDPQLQARAQQLLRDRLNTIEPDSDGRPAQGAVVCQSVEDGSVRALVGGDDFRRSRFNRAHRARRQVGSLVKPFVYLAAMAAAPDGPAFGERLVADTPLALRVGRRIWRPQNYDHRFLGTISWHRGLITSRNVPAVRIGEQAGVARVGDLLGRVGLETGDAPQPSIYLGALEATPLQVAAAYRSIAAGGEYRSPLLIEGWHQGRRSRSLVAGGTMVLDAGHCASMTTMLADVLTEGTGRAARRYQLGRGMAGKTGTSSALRDGWFAGYSPELVTVVWLGRDTGELGLAGATAALPVWGPLMHDWGGNTAFAAPARVLLARSGPDRANGPARPESGAAGSPPPVAAIAGSEMNKLQPDRVRQPRPTKVASQSPVLAGVARQQPQYRLPGDKKPLPNQRYKYFRQGFE